MSQTMEPSEAASAARSDEHDLASFGYKQELHRSLGFFSSFAAAFSYISPSTGIFTLFALGLITVGGVFIWSWPIVAAGQFIIALNFAEISSHFPLAGSVFQWTKYLASRPYAWFTGWIYVAAGILTTTAVLVTFPLAFIPAMNELGWNLSGSLGAQRVIALILLVVVLVLNIFSVKLVAIINNTGVLFEILGMVVFAVILLIVHHHQSIGVVTNSGGLPVNFGSFFAAMFMSLFVIYGFDTASTLAEETNDPRRMAPRAVLTSVAGAFVIGGIFLVALLIAIPNLHAAITGGFGPANIIEANFSKDVAAIYLLIVSAAILVCCMCIMTATIRLCFGMARDNNLPLSGFIRKVHPTLHTPVVACLVIALLAAVPMIEYAGATYVAIAATGMIYLSYFLGNAAALGARLKGWPRVKAPFSLGRWGTTINVLGLLYGGAMIINFAWPRAASNPTPNQTVVNGAQQLKLGFLNGIPILYSVFVAVVVLGAIYYVAIQRRKNLPPVVVPPETGRPS